MLLFFKSNYWFSDNVVLVKISDVSFLPILPRSHECIYCKQEKIKIPGKMSVIFTNILLHE